jgi:predicted HicB family RNase H-like nuclease
MDQALTNIAEQEVLPNNRQAFRAMAQPFKQKLSEIAQQNDLVDKSAEVKRLKREFSKRVQRFKENQKALEESRKELEGKGYTPQQRAALERQLRKQANIGVQDGKLAGGLSQKRMFGEAKTPDEVLSDLNFKQTLTQQVRPTPGDTITKSTFKGVRPARIEQEALRTLGFQKTENGELQRIQSPRDPGLANWLQAERARIRQSLQANNENLSGEELENKVERRVRNRLRSSVRGAVNQMTQGGTRTTVKGNPDSDPKASAQDNATKEGIIQYTGRQVSVSDMPRNADSDTRAMAKGVRNQLWNQYWKRRPEGGVDRQDFQKYLEMKKKHTGPDGQPSTVSAKPGSFRPSSNQSLKQAVKNEWGEGTYQTFKNIEEDRRQMENQSVGLNFISINQDQERGRIKNVLDTVVGDGSTLEIPKLKGDPWLPDTFGGITIKEEKRDVWKNSTFQGLSGQGDMIKMQYEGGGNVENMKPQETYFIEATQQIRNELAAENILGGQVSQMIKGNQKLEGIEIDNTWTDVGGGVDMRMQAQGNMSKGVLEPRFEVRPGNKSLSYREAAKQVQNSDKPQSEKDDDYAKIAETARNNGIRMTKRGLKNYLQVDEKELSEEEKKALDQNIRFQNRWAAFQWGQKF